MAEPEPTTEDRRDPSGIRLAIWLALVVTLIALNYVGRFAIEQPEGTDTRDALYEWSTVGGVLIQFGLLLGATLWLASGIGPRRQLALRRPTSWKLAAGLVVATFVGTYVIAGIVSQLGVDAGEEQGLTPEGWDSSRAAPFLANAILIVAFVPLVEELMFRGLGFSLLARYGAATAIVGTGLLFALGHGVLLGLPIFVFLGIALAYIRARVDSVYPTIAMHSCFNLIALVAAVTLGERT